MVPPRRVSIAVLIAALAAAALSAQTPAHHNGDPFAFLSPTIVLTPGERERLAQDHVITRVLPGRDGQVGIFVASKLSAPPDALVAWTRMIAELKRSKFVLAIGRFSDPPRVEDLEKLTLEPADLESIRRCVPGDCGLKLPAPAIRSLRAAAAGPDWQNEVQREFRRIMVQRVNEFRLGGMTALPPLVDRSVPRRTDAALTAIVEQAPFLKALPELQVWLGSYPHATGGVESFIYWSKERYGDSKPVILITHVGIVRTSTDHRVPTVLVAGREIFATHYLDGSLGVTMVLRDEGGDPYLVYLNRSKVDLLRGLFGGFIRRMLESRLSQEAPQIINGLRLRLESGEPSDDPLDR